MFEGIDQVKQIEFSKSEALFQPSEGIDKPDGWLKETGIFWGCRPDQHDECAKFVYTTEEKGGEVDQPYRTLLQKLNYAQLSNNRVIPPFGRRLSQEQLEKITEAGLRVPISITDPNIAKEFIGLQEAIKSGALSNDVLDLIRRFLENDLLFKSDDDRETADKLFDALTIGFKDAGEAVWPSQGTEERFRERYLLNEQMAVEVRHHKHDGGSGNISYTSWVQVVPYSQMVHNLGYDPENKQ